MFKVGDVVRHKASGERFVIVSSGSRGWVCDSGKREMFPEFHECALELIPTGGSEGSRCVSPVTAELGWYISEDGKIKRVEKDDKAWNLSGVNPQGTK